MHVKNPRGIPFVSYSQTVVKNPHNIHVPFISHSLTVADQINSYVVVALLRDCA